MIFPRKNMKAELMEVASVGDAILRDELRLNFLMSGSLISSKTPYRQQTIQSCWYFMVIIHIQGIWS